MEEGIWYQMKTAELNFQVSRWCNQKLHPKTYWSTFDHLSLTTPSRYIGHTCLFLNWHDLMRFLSWHCTCVGVSVLPGKYYKHLNSGCGNTTPHHKICASINVIISRSRQATMSMIIERNVCLHRGVSMAKNEIPTTWIQAYGSNLVIFN